ncbi:hypothetical protein [Actinoplanes sp. TFC3]|uniref:hypothetical protein n=1 Tax=Actinoplanes sp. TFC3 TaxID=1710355 RepID=UPI00082D7624|nr:hypothetical protein [Actinoplanes sp. TFC3]
MIENAGPADLIERCLANFTTGIHIADNLTLNHEAERLESLPTSAAVTRMRAIVAAEQDIRRPELGATRRSAPARHDASPRPANTTPDLGRAAA